MYKTVNPKPSVHPEKSLRAQAEMSYSFNNNTGHNIVVVTRTGTDMMIPPTMQGHSNGVFSVVVTFTLYGSSNMNVLLSTYDKDSVERQVITEALEYGRKEGNRLSIRYEFDLEQFEEGRPLHFRALDLVIGLHRHGEVITHPSSRRYIAEELANAKEQFAFNYNLLVVDSTSSSRNEKRFINVNNDVFSVPTLSDSYLADGIYISYNCGEKSKVSFYELDDDKCPVVFYSTHKEAEDNGDVLGKIKREHDLLIARSKEAASEYESQAAAHKRKYDEEKHEREREHKERIRLYEEQKYEQDMRLKKQEDELKYLRELRDTALKTQEQEIKHRYDRSTQQRKDTSEWLKIIPATISLAGLVIGLYAKVKS